MQCDTATKKKNPGCVCAHTCCAHLAAAPFYGDTGMSISLFTAERRGDKHFIMPKTVLANSRSFAGLSFVVLNCRRWKKQKRGRGLTLAVGIILEVIVSQMLRLIHVNDAPVMKTV